jgi:hypothetical protein
MPPDPTDAGRLDEKALRRPDWQDGQACRLADGQDWVLARPVVRWVPDDGELGARVRVRMKGDPALAAGFEAAYARLQEVNASERLRVAEMAAAELACVQILLRVNYDLTAAQAAELLQFGYSQEADPEGWQVRDECMNVVYGVAAPKPSAAGDTSA